MTRLRSVLGAVIYFLIVVVIALGAAGLVIALDHPPGSTGGPDLSAPYDAEVTARLDAAETDLNALADQVEALGTTARSALSSLNGADAAPARATSSGETNSCRRSSRGPACCGRPWPRCRTSARRRPG